MRIIDGSSDVCSSDLVAYIFARRYNFPVEEAFNLPRLKRTFIEALPTFTLPVIILGGIFGGFVTATEAAGLAVLAALLVGLYYREFDLRLLRSEEHTYEFQSLMRISYAVYCLTKKTR